jgi:signal transduction histidine kinase
MYSAVVFGLGGLILGLLYLGIRWQLAHDTHTIQVVRGALVSWGGRTMIVPQIEEAQVRSLENLFNQVVIDRMADLTLIAFGFLFLLSMFVGWILAGRALAPIARITEVAEEIQASDLSRRIALQGPDDELKRLAGTFDRMLARLEQAFSSQRRFLADTSHDLRTPLAAIRSNVEVSLADNDTDGAEWRATGEIVARNAERMSNMIDGLLATARLQNRQAAQVEIDLGRMVAEAADDVRASAAEHHVELKATTASVTVNAEPVALRRAFDNLLDNALKASPADSTVLLASGLKEGWAFLAVADEGPGFEPGEPGNGLGLSIVRQVAEGHGGEFHVHAGPSGSTCVVWIPYRGEGQPPADDPLASI